MDQNDYYSIYSGIDTSETLVCFDDRDKIKSGVMKLFAIAIFLCFIVLPSIRNSSLFEKALFIFVITSIMFAIGLALFRIYFRHRSVVISPGGIEDSGITTQRVPWTTVEATVLKTVPRALTGRQGVAVLLRLKPHTRDTLKLTRRGRMLFLNGDALWIPVGGGMIVDGNPASPERFSRIIEAYVRAYGKGAN